MLAILKQKGLFGDAFWALSGQLLSALALLLGTRALTEWLTPQVFGEVALLNGFVALGVAVFSYPFICAGMRMLPECANHAERSALQTTVIHLTVYATVLAIFLILLVGGIYCYRLHADFGLFVMVGSLLMVTVRRELGIQLLIADRRQCQASLWQSCDSILRPVVALGLVWWLGPQVAWVLLGYVAASMVASMIGAYIQQRQAGIKRQSCVVRPFGLAIWHYALPLIPMEMMFWINGLADRYVIGYLLSAAEVGVYAASYTIINEAFNRSAMVLLRTFQPAYFQSYSEHRRAEAGSILGIWLVCVVLLGMVGVSLVMVSKEWLAGLLLAKSYQAASLLMPAIAVGCGLQALGGVVLQPLLARKRTSQLLKGRLCGALAAIISIPLMVHTYGLIGAAMANPIYFGIEALVLALLAKPWQSFGLKSANTAERPVCRATA